MQIVDKAHAKLSASSSHRWLHCPKSVYLEQQFPDSSSIFADEGTLAHEIADKSLTEDRACSSFVGAEYKGIVADDEMCEYVQQYVDFVNNLHGLSLTEVRVDFSEYVTDGFGTCDSLVIKDDTVYITDLKYGKGVKVSAENNEQLMLYALGSIEFATALTEKEITTFSLTIVQPRLDSISTFEISLKRLLSFGEFVKKRVEATKDVNAKAVPSQKSCKFCKAKPICKAYIDDNLSKITKDFDVDYKNIELIPHDLLNNTEISNLIPFIKSIENWCSSFNAHALSIMERGEKIDGYKLVEGRSLRKWALDEMEVIEKLTEKGLSDEEIHTKKLLTLAQLEKKFNLKKAKWFNDLTFKPQGSPTIAPIDDKRQALNINITDNFDNQ